ncbi:hypothetical protein DSUL_20380 [Desulfovibrionales bacterium]
MTACSQCLGFWDDLDSDITWDLIVYIDSGSCIKAFKAQLDFFWRDAIKNIRYIG